jgi:hypothetical protein
VDITEFSDAAEDVILRLLKENGFGIGLSWSHDPETTYSSWIVTHASRHAMNIFTLKLSHLMSDMQVTEL